MMATLRRRGLAITIQPVYCTHDSTPNARRLPQSRQQVSRAIAELLVVDDALGILPRVARSDHDPTSVLHARLNAECSASTAISTTGLARDRRTARRRRCARHTPERCPI